MHQGGIVATGSWDKTLKVNVHPLFPPNSIAFPCLFRLFFFSQHMVADAEKHVPPLPTRIPTSIGISGHLLHWLLWNSRKDVMPWT